MTSETAYWRALFRQSKAVLTDKQFDAMFSETWDEFVEFKIRTQAWWAKKAKFQAEQARLFTEASARKST